MQISFLHFTSSMHDLTRNECIQLQSTLTTCRLDFPHIFCFGYSKHPLIQSNSLNKVVKIPHKTENMTIIKLSIGTPEPFTFFVPFFLLLFFKYNKVLFGPRKLFMMVCSYFSPSCFMRSALLAHIDIYAVVSVGFCLLLFDLTFIRMAIHVCTHFCFPSLFWGCSLVDVCERKTQELLRWPEIGNSFEITHDLSQHIH